MDTTLGRLITEPAVGRTARIGSVRYEVLRSPFGFAVEVRRDGGIPVVRFFRHREEIRAAWGALSLGVSPGV